jgi:hypothetical protein
MEHGDGLYAPDDVYAHIMRQDFVLWAAIKDERVIGMAVASIDAYPRRTIATVRWAGGEPQAGRDWLHPMIDELKRWGKHFGATQLAGAGRRGWLRGFGFRENGVLFEQGID